MRVPLSCAPYANDGNARAPTVTSVRSASLTRNATSCTPPGDTYRVVASTSSFGGVRSTVTGALTTGRSAPRYGRQKSSCAHTSSVAGPSRSPTAVASKRTGSSPLGPSGASDFATVTGRPPCTMRTSARATLPRDACSVTVNAGAAPMARGTASTARTPGIV